MAHAGRHERKAETGPRRRGVIIGAGAAGLVVLGGGAAALVATQGGDGSGGSDGGGLFAGSGRSTTPPPPPRAVDSLADESSKVPEIATTDLSGLADPRSVSFPRLPRARGLSEALDMAVNKILREHVYSGAEASALSVTGTVFAAGADVLGAALLHTDAQGEVPAVVYYRSAEDRPFTSPGLIAPERWADLEKAVASAAGDVEGVDAASLAHALQQQPRPWGNGPAIIPLKDGTLHLVFPAATVAGKPAAAEVILDAATAKPLLSEDGTAVLAALASPAPFDPATVTDPPGTKGDADYIQPPEVGAPASPREADPTGPDSQLAPLSGPGVRPSPVAAPDATRLKAVALTFDDGPDPNLNQPLRDALNEHRAASTFYFIGKNVKEYASWCAKTAANGMEIGSHSWSHVQLSAQSGDKLNDEVVKPTDEIAAAAGRPPFVMRPPYGARNDRVDEAVGAQGQSSQIWDVDTLDWKTKSAPKNVSAVQGATVRGSIVLMHEIHPTSVEAVPDILDWLDENGYTLLTSSELGQNQMRAGKHYMQGLVTHEIAPPAGASDGGAG